MNTVKSSLVFALMLAFAGVPLVAGVEPDGIAAVVNQEVITYDDINFDVQAWKEMADLRQKYQGDEQREKMRAARLATLQRLIETRLIIQDFRRQGGFTPDSWIDERVEAGIKQDYGGKKEALAAALAKYGETMDEYRASIEDGAIVAFMTRQNVEKKLTATDPVEAAKQRESLRQAWLATLRSTAYIQSFAPVK